MKAVQFKLNNSSITISVREDYLKTCPNPADFELLDLMGEYKLMESLHNPAGPALRDDNSGMEVYYINGKELSEDEVKKLKHDQNFYSDLDDYFEGK